MIGLPSEINTLASDRGALVNLNSLSRDSTINRNRVMIQRQGSQFADMTKSNSRNNLLAAALANNSAHQFSGKVFGNLHSTQPSRACKI